MNNMHMHIYLLWFVPDKEKKLEEEFLRGLEDSDGSNGANEADKHKDARDLNIFSFVSILEATNNFAQENKLGQGGFGPVYKVNTN